MKKEKFFEYHCYEGHDSSDAELWYHSHQKVEILNQIISEDIDEEETGKMFHIRFLDGFEANVFEDELMNSRSEFYRPDPPLQP